MAAGMILGSLYQEIDANLPFEQQLLWQRSAVECLQVAVEKYLIMNMATGTLNAAHPGYMSLMVFDQRLVNNIMNVMARKSDQKTQEERSDNDNYKPLTTRYHWYSRLLHTAGNTEGSDSDDGNDRMNGESGDRDGNGEGNEREVGGGNEVGAGPAGG
ncbi:hypothetical protein HOY80DRAFT_1093968 [Tuber brumale]|nr:hypothetical protein HOY80DRAFT_1093968 [Tuber brumale]